TRTVMVSCWIIFPLAGYVFNRGDRSMLNKKSSVYPCNPHKNMVTDGEGNCQGLAEMRRGRDVE
ncbi:MAG: hypothetical protein ABWU13_10830, partial [Limnospira maxima]